jgi:hypothetical protein
MGFKVWVVARAVHCSTRRMRVKTVAAAGMYVMCYAIAGRLQHCWQRSLQAWHDIPDGNARWPHREPGRHGTVCLKHNRL